MPVDRGTFDADLTAYIAAVDAFIALPQVIDLANEDAEVQAALGRIPQAPPPPPGPQS